MPFQEARHGILVGAAPKESSVIFRSLSQVRHGDLCEYALDSHGRIMRDEGAKSLRGCDYRGYGVEVTSADSGDGVGEAFHIVGLDPAMERKGQD